MLSRSVCEAITAQAPQSTVLAWVDLTQVAFESGGAVNVYKGPQQPTAPAAAKLGEDSSTNGAPEVRVLPVCMPSCSNAENVA